MLPHPDYPAVVQRGPSVTGLVFLTVLVSVLSSAATVLVMYSYGVPEWLAAKRSGGTPAAVAVPELTGLSRQAAEEVLTARGLLLVVEAHAAAKLPADAVVTQKPLAGSQVHSGDAITVVLSEGAAWVSVPEIVGTALQDAKTELRVAGLEVGEVASGEGGKPGIVMAAEPAPGTEVDPGSSVALTVGSEALVRVPKLRNLHVRAAKQKLADAGLAVGDVSERYDRRKRGYLVLTQTPKAGEKVQAGTAVSLVINQGD